MVYSRKLVLWEAHSPDIDGMIRAGEKTALDDGFYFGETVEI
jgi:hypothetical protein